MSFPIWRLLLVGNVLMSPVLADSNSRDIVKIGGDIVVEEEMTIRNAVAVGGDVEVKGQVAGTAVSIGGSVVLAPTAVVRGDAVSIGGSVEEERGAQIEGTIVETGVEIDIPGFVSPDEWEWGRERNWARFLWGVRIATLLGFLVLALVLVAVVPTPFAAVGDAVTANLVSTILWGLLGFVLIGPVTGLLLLSVVGIALIPLELIALACAFLVGYIALAQVVGHRLLLAVRRPDQPVILQVFLGLLAVSIIGWIPILGWLFTSIVLLIGFGGVLATVYSALKTRRPASASS